MNVTQAATIDKARLGDRRASTPGAPRRPARLNARVREVGAGTVRRVEAGLRLVLELAA